jgi:hypothetical protein
VPEELTLTDLAAVRLRVLLAEDADAPNATLDAIMRRLFDPDDRDLLAVSAFASAL